jgi:hypothetical protein
MENLLRRIIHNTQLRIDGALGIVQIQEALVEVLREELGDYQQRLKKHLAAAN